MSKKIDHVAANYYQSARSMAQSPAMTRVRQIEFVYMDYFTELCTTRFVYDGLPSEVNVRFMEMQLFYNGLAIFFKDRMTDKFMALKGSAVGHLNMLDEPTAFEVIGNNFTPRTLVSIPRTTEIDGVYTTLPEQCIPIWNNYMRRGDWLKVSVFARRLAEIERTLEIATLNHRNPRIIASDENGRLTMENINRQINEGADVIRLKTSTANQLADSITSLEIAGDVKAIGELSIERNRIFSNLMTLLGINNSNQDKKERIQAAEVEANNQQVDSARFIALSARQTAVAAINARYDLDISVKYRLTEEEERRMVLESILDVEGNNA